MRGFRYYAIKSLTPKGLAELTAQCHIFLDLLGVQTVVIHNLEYEGFREKCVTRHFRGDGSIHCSVEGVYENLVDTL